MVLHLYDLEIERLESNSIKCWMQLDEVDERGV